MASGNYKLELEPPKRNIFVTQLNDREDEDEDQNANFPVVKESASKLLENGINTLQKTLLLKKQVEVEDVDEELQLKREEFQQRMEACSEKQIEIQKRQQSMKDRVAKFEKFIKENEAKRRRAIQKYQQEVKLKQQKDAEYEILCQQLAELKAQQDYLRRKIAKYEKFRDYLLEVVDILPANYIEAQDSMVNSLMMRHRTLYDTNVSLVENLQTKQDELEQLKQTLQEYQLEHNKMKLAINSELSLKQKSQEFGLDHNQEREQKFMRDKSVLRMQRSQIGQIIMAINNLSEKCVRKMDPDIDSLDLEGKLEIVKKYIMDKTGVVSLAEQDSSRSPTLERKSPAAHPRSKPTIKFKT